MIKIVVVALGKNRYSAFSLNQEFPLLSTFTGDGTESRKEIERTLIIRFHTQRNKYKEQGACVARLTRRNAWKFIWTDTSVFWNKTKPQVELETLVNEPGLQISRQTPQKHEPMYIAESTDDGKCSFTPLSKDIIAESEIPAYIKEHQKDTK